MVRDPDTLSVARYVLTYSHYTINGISSDSLPDASPLHHSCTVWMTFQMADWKPYSGLNVGNSLRVQIDPNNLRRFNYGNSDYNFPHTVSANYYWQLPFKSQNKLANLAIRGWAVSGALYSKSGEQFSIYDTRPWRPSESRIHSRARDVSRRAEDLRAS